VVLGPKVSGTLFGSVLSRESGVDFLTGGPAAPEDGCGRGHPWMIWQNGWGKMI